MAKKATKTLRCPSCKEIVQAGDPDFPFCSDRCRIVDLGKWASGGYVISSPVTDPEGLEALERAMEKRLREHGDDPESHKDFSRGHQDDEGDGGGMIQ